MGADLDFSNPQVREQCIKWGQWYLETTGVNGFRFDAVKHIEADFIKEFLETIRETSGKELFSVGEYWNGDINALHDYLTKVDGALTLFDVPLH